MDLEERWESWGLRTIVLGIETGARSVWSLQTKHSEVRQSPYFIISMCSKCFKEKLIELKEKGFDIKECKTNYLLYWKDENSDQEVKIILPEIYLEKND